MTGIIESIERAQMRSVPVFDAGDRVRVHFQVVEGTRRRTQVFEGVVIKRQGSGARETFTVRKQSFGVGVERTFPVHSPKIERIEVASRGDVRRAKLYYLRGRVGRRARIRERRDVGPAQVEPTDLVRAPDEAPADEAPPTNGDAPETAEPDAPETAGGGESVDASEAGDTTQASEAPGEGDAPDADEAGTDESASQPA